MAWSIFREGGGDPVAVGWAHALLRAIGAPETPGNVQFVYQWEKAEGGGGKYNPLNQGPVPSHPELTTTGSQYGGGAADYASWDAGIQGAADYLNMGNYSAVKAALIANNPDQARHALWSSPWAASHYGFGSQWPNVSTPNVTPQIPGTGTGTSPTGVTPTGFGTNISSLIKAFKLLGDPNFWKRIGVGGFGMALILAGLYFMISKQPDSFKPVRKLANIT